MKYFALTLGVLLFATVAFSAVELTSFTAVPGVDQIQLNWTTASEQQNDHFEILRDNVLVGNVPGAGSSPVSHDYSWIDTDVLHNHTYAYTLTAVDANSTHDSLATVNGFAGTVGLMHFSAVWAGTAVALTWATEGEVQNDHFDVIRDGAIVASSTAHNGSNRRAYARWDSTAITGHAYTYYLVVITMAGDSVTLDSVYLSSEAVTPSPIGHPESFQLSAYPNPFNSATALTFVLPRGADTQLSVYDVAGRKVRDIYSGWMSAGEHRILFDGAPLATGLYLAQLRSGQQTNTAKLFIIK